MPTLANTTPTCNTTKPISTPIPDHLSSASRRTKHQQLVLLQKDHSHPKKRARLNSRCGLRTPQERRHGLKRSADFTDSGVSPYIPPCPPHNYGDLFLPSSGRLGLYGPSQVRHGGTR
ncbi:hypothetical protein GCM10017687_47530 [Streptomyces echinatus]